MAKQEHLDLLEQEIETWNHWRKEHPDALIDLSKANLMGAHLTGADLRGANFKETRFDGANLSGADLRGATFISANLSWTNINKADLTWADLSWADLTGATLERTTLFNADLSGANLFRANLRSASLRQANLSRAALLVTELTGADLSQSNVASTIFGDVDLSTVIGLDAAIHPGPSTIGIDTFIRSKGNISERFLRNAGVPDLLIDYMRSLTSNPIEYSPCFISYSNKDEFFARQLYADLQNRGVRCWFAHEHLKIGDKLRPTIDASIYLYDKLLLVLSQHSIASQWVEQEVATALAKEREEHKIVLFPIRLDNDVMDIEHDWPVFIRNTRHIGDFTRWTNSQAYQQAFERLLSDLQKTG